MTPAAKHPVPLTLDNPFVPKRAKVKEATDRSAATGQLPEPLVLINPYVHQASVVASKAK